MERCLTLTTAIVVLIGISLVVALAAVLFKDRFNPGEYCELTFP